MAFKLVSRHKFNAKPVKTEEGEHFSSKLEFRYFQELQLRQKCGEVLFFLRQVPFHLPGNKKYVCDFMEFLSNGDIIFTEVKGFTTELWKLKLSLVEDLYPIKINVITKV